jgi:hypothetical protein
MPAPATLFHAATQQHENVSWEVDANNEVVATFPDGRIVKFPAGLTVEQFDELIRLHEEHNTGQVVITPEFEAAQAAERDASLALLGTSSEPEASGDSVDA